MASDDKERNKNEGAPLPASVQRALAEARASAGKAGRVRAPAAATRSGRWLALIPVTAAVLMFLLMMPRAVPPEDVPLPKIDGRALGEVVQDDVRRARSAREIRLPGEVLAVGTAVRGINRAQAGAASVEELTSARGKLDDALRELSAVERVSAIEGLKSLRAVQLEAFLEEVERFERTGEVTAELEELGGAFIDRMAAAGWVEGRRVLLEDAQRRVAFKLVWTAMVGADHTPELQLTLDEQRALYTLYLARPHAPEIQRASFEALRRAATSEADCDRAVAKERASLELWRADKIKKLGELDPTYPTQYALGVAYYRASRFDLSMESFRSWLTEHPEGPLALRARNHMKAALAAYGPS